VTERVFVITPELTPGAGGVGDHTLRLLENLPGRENIRLLVTSGHLKELPADGKVFVQYSAYGFDRLGYPRKLIQALIDWKKRSRGRLVIMFHEIWTFWPMTNKNFFVQFLHRRAIKRLLSYADAVFTSTPSQAGHLRALSPRARIHVLPVGSNICRKSGFDLPRRAGWAIVFGRQSARLRALKKMRDSLKSLVAAGRISGIVAVGADSDPQAHEEENKLLASLGLSDGFEQHGAQSEAIVSEMLSTASFGIFGQDELSYGKSGTFMAYAAHELNVLSEFADASGPEPVCWLIAPRELLEGISQAELQSRAEHLCDWQQRTASWELIGTTVAQALELDSTGRLRIQSARQ
jgi:glycosyltransferase involved in cell wall biosynthesis